MNPPPSREEAKRALRSEVRSWLRLLSAEELSRRSVRIVDRVRERIRSAGAESVGTFAALPGEPDLAGLWALPVQFVFPKVSGPELTLWRVPEPGGLTVGYRGILEPDEARCERIEPQRVDLMLVPGLAFGETDGRRLGRGGGYYDRLLCGMIAPRWGICFEEQVRATVPWEDHDVAVQVLVTCAKTRETG